MHHRKIYAPNEDKRGRDSRLKLFGRRLLETLFRESSEISHLRSLMRKLNHDPPKSTISEIREVGTIFRSLQEKERAPALELEVFYCLSRAKTCSSDPALRGVAETEFRITDWKIRVGNLQTFLNTS